MSQNIQWYDKVFSNFATSFLSRSRKNWNSFWSCSSSECLCQYKIEAEEPLYDILIDNVLHDYSNDESVAHDKYKTDIDTDKEDTDGEDGEDEEDNNNSD